jgi:hypothetical protein
MRKKGKKIKNRAVSPPMMVVMEQHKEMLLAEQLAVVSLMNDETVDNHQYNVLWNCYAMLVYGIRQTKKPDMEANAVADMAEIALRNIRGRWEDRGVVRATGDEISAVKALVDFSEDWWRRKGGDLFAKAFFETEKLVRDFNAKTYIRPES